VSLDPALSEGPIVLFDGVCHFCHGVVRFVVARDPKEQIRFAPLQSKVGQELAAVCGAETQDVDSVILIADGRAYTKSDAGLRIAARLSGLWPVLKVFLLVPRPIRNWVYDYVARNRYRWFGKAPECLAPTAELRRRFLS